MTLTTSFDRVSEPAARTPRLTWLAPLGMVGLSAVLFLLRILTLGMHHFWGKTEVRKRIWSSIRLEGEPLVYTGTGRELFTGFLTVFGLLLLPASLLSFGALAYFGQQSWGYSIFSAVIYALFYLLVGVGTYRAQRYRMSRTLWRGISGNVDGNSWHYGWTHFWSGLLIPLTLGWIIPWRSTRLQRLITNDMHFGDRRFRFGATSGQLYPRFLVLWIGAAAILAGLATFAASIWGSAFQGRIDPNSPRIIGLVLALYAGFAFAYLLYAILSGWYRAGQIRLFAAGTHFGDASFRSTVTAGGLIWLAVTNFLLNILSLWMLYPVTQTRTARYLVENLAIEGAMAPETLGQGTGAAGTRGEGLAQAFDVDAF